MSKKKKNEDRGPTWEGYYPRLTKTKHEQEIANERKEKQRRRNCTDYEDYGDFDSDRSKQKRHK